MMDKRNKQILELYARLDNLIRNQDSLAREIKALRSEIDSLSAKSVTLMQEEPEEPVILAGRQGPGSWWSIKFPDLIRVNTEEFIGGNLINKIGIVILILGVGIGIKFAIDRDLISPLVRLLLGYMVGIMLLFLAHRTRRNYLNFSAVLASGSLATVYFITYAGNSYYAIIPQSAAYILMITITVYAIFLSLNYDKEVIAIIGLVGAYAVPYLLGRKTENYLALFLYISIINGGVLVVSIRKFWRWLLYGAFIVTWLMYISWQRSMYVPEND
ncbi:MAG: DUF2339 domain-containing protein, partial [Cyclobacteriaceae bacterium]|nr:DUF2339 domain-containing protein [Cyclobacteriaceae bacterium]